MCPPDRLGRGKEISVNENDIMKMSGEQIDEYLDWSEKTWVDESQESRGHDLPKQLLDMFPTGRLNGSIPVRISFGEEAEIEKLFVDEKLMAVQGHLRVRSVISEKHETESNKVVRRIGSFYKRYREIEDLPPHAKLFYETAATLISTSLAVLVQAVLHIEAKLQYWRMKQLKDEQEELGDIAMEDIENVSGNGNSDRETVGNDSGDQSSDFVGRQE